MYTVIRTDKASNDLESIANYISQDNPYRALSFIQELMSSFIKKIFSYPFTGTKCKNFYYSVYKNYFIFYDIEKNKKEVVILHIVHTSQYTAYEGFL